MFAIPLVYLFKRLPDGLDRRSEGSSSGAFREQLEIVELSL